MKTPTQDEIRIAERIIARLCNNMEVEGFEYSRFYEWVDDNSIFLHNNKIEISTGETKICFICDELTDWVIKRSFDDNLRDDCLVEFENYQKACGAQLGRFFAAMHKLDHGFYLQERVHVNEDENHAELEVYASSYLEKEPDDSDEKYSAIIDDEIMDMNDSDRIHGFLGEDEETERLDNFCYNNGINDLHAGNWGYADRGYVIIDYSGFVG